MTCSVRYWFAPVSKDEFETATHFIARVMGREKICPSRPTTPWFGKIKPGDWVCFYSGDCKGIVGHARVASELIYEPNNEIVNYPEKYPYYFRLEDVVLYLNNPVYLSDKSLRDKLSMYAGKKHDRSWGWIALTVRELCEEDFKILTRGWKE